jgi:hypothetical protein
VTGADDSKVIGYFAYASPGEVVCNGDACLVAGSETAMASYLADTNNRRGILSLCDRTVPNRILYIQAG